MLVMILVLSHLIQMSFSRLHNIEIKKLTTDIFCQLIDIVKLKKDLIQLKIRLLQPNNLAFPSTQFQPGDIKFITLNNIISHQSPTASKFHLVNSTNT
jgi:hypothetical protein